MSAVSPVATEFCIAARFRDVPTTDITLCDPRSLLNRGPAGIVTAMTASVDCIFVSPWEESRL
jgi:hypothetical protein